MGLYKGHLPEISEETNDEWRTETQIRGPELIFLMPFTKKINPNHLSPIREGDEVSTTKETPPMKRDDNRDLQTKPANSKVTEDRLHGEKSMSARNERPQQEIPIKNDSELIIPELTSWNYSAESDDLNLRAALRVPFRGRLPSRHRADSEVTEPLSSEHYQDQDILGRAGGGNDPDRNSTR